MTKLRNAVQHNLPAKILALLVAVVLWLYVMNDQNPAIEGNYTVPVTIENAPDGYQINAAADTVTIACAVRGRSLLRQTAAIFMRAFASRTLSRGRRHIPWKPPFLTVLNWSAFRRTRSL